MHNKKVAAFIFIGGYMLHTFCKSTVILNKDSGNKKINQLSVIIITLNHLQITLALIIKISLHVWVDKISF